MSLASILSRSIPLLHMQRKWQSRTLRPCTLSLTYATSTTMVCQARHCACACACVCTCLLLAPSLCPQAHVIGARDADAVAAALKELQNVDVTAVDAAFSSAAPADPIPHQSMHLPNTPHDSSSSGPNDAGAEEQQQQEEQQAMPQQPLRCECAGVHMWTPWQELAKPTSH